MQALEKPCADATQVAGAVLSHDPRGAQFQKVPCHWLAREDFIDGEEDLIRLQCWSEVTQVLDHTGRLCSPRGQHALPISPGDALGRTDLLPRQCRINGCVQFGWPSGTAPRLFEGHDVEVQGGKVVPCRQRGDLGLLNLSDELTMGAHQAADRGVGEKIVIVGLPAEQASDRDKGQFLGQQASPFL